MSTAIPPNDEPNPYASPVADLTPPVEYDGQCYRRGKFVIIPHDAELPPRCFRCNEPARWPIPRWTIYWHPAWVYFSILGVFILYFFVAGFYQRKAVIAPGLCPKHTAQRRRWKIGAWLLFIASLACLSKPAIWPVGLVGLAVTAILKIMRERQLQPVLIDNGKVILKGCGEPFLDSLPPSLVPLPGALEARSES